MNQIIREIFITPFKPWAYPFGTTLLQAITYLTFRSNMNISACNYFVSLYVKINIMNKSISSLNVVKRWK